MLTAYANGISYPIPTCFMFVILCSNIYLSILVLFYFLVKPNITVLVTYYHTLIEVPIKEIVSTHYKINDVCDLLFGIAT